MYSFSKQWLLPSYKMFLSLISMFTLLLFIIYYAYNLCKRMYALDKPFCM